MKKFLFGLLVASLLVSCSKEQRTVNKLEGEWTVVSAKIGDENGSTTDEDASGFIKFEKCKLKTDDFCQYSYNIVTDIGTFAGSAEYKVIEEGEMILVRDDATDSSVEQQDIITLGRDILILRDYYSETGYIEVEYIK